jgi:uncharacterized membrane protein
MKIIGLSVLAVLLAACIEWTELGDVSCPPEGTTHTWQNFGQGFFVSYCNECHSVHVDDRKGAPIAYVFDTRDQVFALRDRIFIRSAGDNTTMPPGPDDPPKEHRDMLAEWLACGAPEEAMESED